MAKNQNVVTAEVAIQPETAVAVAVEAEQPKTPEVKSTKTVPADRLYQLTGDPSVDPKGKQRLYILQVMRTDKERAWSAKEIVPLVEKKGYSHSINFSTLDSVRWHLHQMFLNKIVTLVNPQTIIQ
jgi:hypothetical protein